MNKTLIEIPAGGFYVYNPKKEPNDMKSNNFANKKTVQYNGR